MRQLFFILCTLTSWAAAFATDRVVGPSGSFPSISSALAASADGDRILVEAGTYNEYVQITQSISILPLVEGTRYNVLKELRLFNANGKSILISGMRGTDVGIIGGYSTRTLLRIVDSRFLSCRTLNPYVSTELYRDTLLSTPEISSGSIIGNVIIGSASVSNPVRITGGTALADECYIVGNDIGAVNGPPRIAISSDRVVHIENNFVHGPPDYGGFCILVARTADVVGPASTILNNTVRYTAFDGSSTAIVVVSGAFAQAVTIKNNAATNVGALLSIQSPAAAVTSSNNVLASPTWANAATGEPVNGSPLINAGDPDPRYMDLDLTVNDVGCYGGSNSRANFTTPMGGAVVGFMLAPRVVSQGDAVNINATGFDR